MNTINMWMCPFQPFPLHNYLIFLSGGLLYITYVFVFFFFT